MESRGTASDRLLAFHTFCKASNNPVSFAEIEEKTGVSTSHLRQLCKTPLFNDLWKVDILKNGKHIYLPK